MKKVDLMIFDLDGTLVDSASDIIAAVNHTRGHLGLPPMDDEEVISFVGDGTDKLVERFVGSKQEYRKEAMELFAGYYEEHILDHTILYPSVAEALAFFHAKKKVIITNKSFHFTCKITDGLDITRYFDDIVGMGSTPFRKPDPRIVLPILERFKAGLEETIIFGDGVNDINLAVNAGFRSCALLNGFTPRETLLSLKPDFACEDLGEIKAMFC